MIGIIGATIALGSLAAGIASLGLAWYLSRYRGRAGASWFMLTLTAQALAAISYSVGLVITHPIWREYAEAVAWIGLAWLGPLFLAFTLEYTGRTAVPYVRRFQVVFVFPAGTTLFALTHPYNELLWTDFRIVPTFELSTVLYTIQPWAYITVGVSLITAGVGVLLLVDAILTYGPLYRREAIAVALSTVLPAGALIVWLLGVGPWPALNLALFFFLPHVALDAYAFVGTHMFETNPTTQRAAERTALHDLRDPMVTVDTEANVVNLNERATHLFGIESQNALPIALDELTGAGLEDMRTSGEITVDGSGGGVFAVSYTPLIDPRGESVGGMIVLYDVTEERQRKQQLAVFNRILRHNLRNEMTVIQGHANLIASDADDPQHRTQAASIVGSSQRLLSIATKANDFDRIRERDTRRAAINVSDLVETVTSEIRDTYRDANIAVDVETATPNIHSDPELLSQILSNLIENAIVHAESDSEVTVSISRETHSGSDVVFEIRDTNDRISDLEIESIQAGDETPLQHASGIGLWIVKWCVTTLNGDIEFEYDDGNVITVVLPAV